MAPLPIVMVVYLDDDHWRNHVRVLVTGSDGYIGAVLVPRLVQAGHEVVGLDSSLYAGCTFGPELEPVTTLRMDVRDVGVEELRGFDAVLHLAAISNDPLGNLNPEVTYDINHLASVRLALQAKRAGVGRFLFSSSCSLYGAADGAGPDLRCYRVDCAKLATILPDLELRWTVRRGIEQLYQAFMEYGLELEDLTGSRFQRIAHVRSLISSDRTDDDLRWREDAAEQRAFG